MIALMAPLDVGFCVSDFHLIAYLKHFSLGDRAMNRRFEMYQYRHILARMRLGESDRQIDAAGLMDRRTAAKLRKKAIKVGWLELDQPLPCEQDLLITLQQPKSATARANRAWSPTARSSKTGWVRISAAPPSIRL